MFSFLFISFLLKPGASQEAENCLQARVNKFCADSSGYPYARLNREKDKWRCYGELNADGETAYECVNEDASDIISCIRHADNSPFVQKHNALLEEAEKGCGKF